MSPFCVFVLFPLCVFYFIDLFSRSQATYGARPLPFTTRKFLPLGGLQELYVPLPPPLARPTTKTTATASFGDLASVLLPFFLICPEGLLIPDAIRRSSLTRLRTRGQHLQRQERSTCLLS
jgi:hypothetical protein